MSSDFRQGVVVGALLVGFLFAAFVGFCKAQDWISVHGLAKHLDGQPHCNSTTSGLGYQHTLSEHWRAMAGFYRNSNCVYSTYAGGAYTPLTLGPAHIGGLLGVVTGYKVSPMPAAGFVAAVEWKRFGIDIVFIPPFKDSGNVLWLSLKVPF